MRHLPPANGPGARLRQSLRDLPGERALCAVGAVNALAAVAAAEAGFDALWVSGLELSAASGLPDANVLGVADLVTVVLAATRVTDLPVIVDVDNAAGALPSATRYARELSCAGAAGLCIEDSRYPKCNSFSAHHRQELAPLDLTSGQIAAMRQSVGDDLLIVARTESLICGYGVEHALERGRVLVAAGADALLVHSRDKTGDEVLAIAAGWDRPEPLVVVPTAFPSLTAVDLHAAGFGLCIYANQLSRAALTAMRTAANEFMESGEFPNHRLARVADLLAVGDPGDTATL